MARAADIAFPGFTPGLMTFFRQLARNNGKGWFEANRPRYEAVVRTPVRALVEEMDVRFARIAPEIVGDPRRSIFRIHRDAPLSRAKSPYTTHASCWFFPRPAGRQVGQEATSNDQDRPAARHHYFELFRIELCFIVDNELRWNACRL